MKFFYPKACLDVGPNPVWPKVRSYQKCVLVTFFFFFYSVSMSDTVSKPRIYLAGLPECPLHSIRLKSRYLILTGGNINININGIRVGIASYRNKSDFLQASTGGNYIRMKMKERQCIKSIAGSS